MIRNAGIPHSFFPKAKTNTFKKSQALFLPFKLESIDIADNRSIKIKQFIFIKKRDSIAKMPFSLSLESQLAMANKLHYFCLLSWRASTGLRGNKKGNSRRFSSNSKK